MPYVEIAELYLNLDHVSFIRKEEHSQLGSVLAVHLAVPGATPLYVGDQHYDELRTLLLNSGADQRA